MNTVFFAQNVLFFDFDKATLEIHFRFHSVNKTT